MEVYGDDEFGGCAVGIDLGTTNTVVSVVQDGRVEFIRNEDGGYLHPSVVAFTPSGARLVGARAKRRRAIDPQNTIFSAKRLIGRSFESRDMQEAIRLCPYTVVEGRHQEALVKTRVGPVPVIDASSYVLEHVKELTEAQLDQPVTRCVVTVPAHFGDGQRSATRTAAERAGFEVLRILNEPTAAAIAYGIHKNLDRRVAIFDLGGGTFDATVLAIHGNLFEVLATGGDPYLGGDDLDRLLAEELKERFEREHGIDLASQRHAESKILVAAETIKLRLSEAEEASGTLEELGYGEGGISLDLDFAISREHFESLAAPLVKRALDTVERVLEQAQTAPSLIDDVLLVGGTTKMPMVRRLVAELFGREPKTILDPMLAVGAGAAVQAHTLSEPPADSSRVPLLMDVAAHGIGVITAGRFNDQIIAKNTPIPVVRKRVFSLATDYQTSVEITICEGDGRDLEESTELGTLRLDGLEPAVRGETQIEVSFVLDSDGILKVAAKDKNTGRSEHATLTVNGVGET